MSNRIARSAAALALMTLAVAGTAGAQTPSQTINFSVAAINQVAVSGTVTLDVTTAVAGGNPTQATDNGSTWAVTTNQSGAKISASLDSDMPAGLTLQVSLGAPAGATSVGAVTLSSASVDLVTGVSQVAASGLSMNYTLDAAHTAGVVACGTRTVTNTITGGT
jgi:hypothetical protein